MIIYPQTANGLLNVVSDTDAGVFYNLVAMV